MTTAYIALGANLGDRRDQIDRALAALRDTPGIRVTKISTYLENAAVGGPPDSPPFLNAAAEIQTTLTPHQLLARLLEIEQRLGRQRRDKWDPRIIDLDLLLYGEMVIDEPDLRIPHPLMHQRRFVLEPLNEIAPDAVHPVARRSVRHLCSGDRVGAAFGDASGKVVAHMFDSKTPYEPARIHAAAIYCSDGRLGEHFDDFLMNGLKLPRYDRLALPGGPAALAEHAATKLEHDAVIDELKFLVEVHGLNRVVLIQHQNCAFYTNRLNLQGFDVERQQRDDLAAAAEFVRKVTGVTQVEMYFARRLDSAVRFEEVKF